MTETLRIERLGHRGDGIATVAGRPVFVPFTLPGEVVEATVAGERGEPHAILTHSPERIVPVCRHFGVCGGCALQHLEAAAYLAFKRRLVVDAFADRGLHPAVGETVPVPPESRRRVVLHAAGQGGGLRIGLHERLNSRLVDIEENPVAVPAIVAALQALKSLARQAVPARGELDLTVTATLTGLDLKIAGIDRRMPERQRIRLSAQALELGFVRVSLNDEPPLTRENPVISFGGVFVTPPPGAFLQATEPSEAAMAERVLSACSGATLVADLFAGVGTFALRLARSARVHAVEGSADAVEALLRAARAPGLKPVTAERRDLFRRPLLETELNPYDAVVFDPPRTGAEAQVARLAASRVPTVVAVSCNPATLARDARTLVDGGYRLGEVTPIDQFLWSHHVEVVAVFRR